MLYAICNDVAASELMITCYGLTCGETNGIQLTIADAGESPPARRVGCGADGGCGKLG